MGEKLRERESSRQRKTFAYPVICIAADHVIVILSLNSFVTLVSDHFLNEGRLFWNSHDIDV